MGIVTRQGDNCDDNEHVTSKSNMTISPACSLCIAPDNNTIDVVGTSRRKGGWRAACFILSTEAMERLAFYSISSNLVTYMLNEMHEPLPKAITMITNWIGAAYVLSIPGGFLADAYLGRFCTITIYSVCYILGLTLIVLSATVRSLRPPTSSLAGASSSQEGVLMAGMYMVAVGTGGIKPCVSSFGADQFEDERGMSDVKKMASFFNWFFFAVNIGALFAFTIVVYVQDNVGWGAGLAIPMAGMVASLALLLCGMPLYKYKRPSGSPLTRFLQVLVAAFRQRHMRLPAPPEEQFHQAQYLHPHQASHTHAFRCLDKATISEDTHGEMGNPWRVCSMNQVEECKLFLKILPIMATTLFLWTGYTQLVTFFVKQGSTLDRSVGSKHFQIPPASLPIFSVINALLILPFYDKVVVPIARRVMPTRQAFTPLQRMGFGLFVSIWSMIVAALVERRRLHVIAHYGLQDQPLAIVPMSIFWLVPQYFLVGLAEIFAYVGQLEFFYAEVSNEMRSLSTSLFIAELGFGSWISSLLVTIVSHITGHENGWILDNINRSKVDNFYWLLAVLSAINFLLFVVCATFHRYRNSSFRSTSPL